jgi:hypothetical protein
MCNFFRPKQHFAKSKEIVKNGSEEIARRAVENGAGDGLETRVG